LDEDGRSGDRPQMLRRAGVIHVMMRDDHERDAARGHAQRFERCADLVAVAWIARVDQGRLVALDDEIEVHPLRAQSVDALGNLGRPGRRNETHATTDAPHMFLKKLRS
jgi:hypothetical protein